MPLILISLAVCLDSFAVAVTIGFVAERVRIWKALRAAAILALIQGIMPAIGWLIGSHTKSLVSNFDHWIAFLLLSIIGIRMIAEGMKKKKDRQAFDPFKPLVLIGLAVASSIDALIAGVSFALIDVNILTASAIIFGLTFIVVLLGVFFGKKVGELFGKRMEIIGGIIMIAMGVAILVVNWVYTG